MLSAHNYVHAPIFTFHNITDAYSQMYPPLPPPPPPFVPVHHSCIRLPNLAEMETSLRCYSVWLIDVHQYHKAISKTVLWYVMHPLGARHRPPYQPSQPGDSLPTWRLTIIDHQRCVDLASAITMFLSWGATVISSLNLEHLLKI